MTALPFFIHLLSIHYQLTRARVCESESVYIKVLSFLFNFTRMFRGALTRNPEHSRKPFPAKSVAYVTCAKFIRFGAHARTTSAREFRDDRAENVFPTADRNASTRKGSRNAINFSADYK